MTYKLIPFGCVLFSAAAIANTEPAKNDKITAQTHKTNKNTSLTNDNLTEKDWSGAFKELGSILLLGKAAYLSGGDTITRDFDYEIEGNEFEYFHDRLFTKQYLKLDDNSLGMNWGHAYAGMIYYQAFRNHNFNFYESTLATVAASTAWEVFFEYKEVVSLNDQIVTSIGGAVLGESLFQFSELLSHKKGWVPQTFSAIFNPAKTIQSWFGWQQANRLNYQNVNDVFKVYGSLLSSSNDTRDLDKSMINLGFYASADSWHKNYDALSGTPTFVEIDAQAGISELGLEDYQMTSMIILGGYHSNHTRMQANKDQKWDEWYQSVYLGPSIGLEYASFGSQEDDEDFYAAIHVLGLSTGIVWQRKELSLSIDASVHADFTMVKPFASQGIENYRDFYWNSKSALWENAYAYALGHTANIKFTLDYHQIQLLLSMRSQRWDSIDNKNIERFGDWNPNRKDLDFKDARDRVQFQVNYHWSPGLSLGLHLEEIHRSGEYFGIDFPDFYAQADDIERRAWLQVNYSY